MRHTQEQMLATIQEWQKSGLSKKAFCRQREITYQTFHYWCKRVLSGKAKGFTEVKVVDQGHCTCELIFPSGARMVFQDQPSVVWVRELVR